MVLRARFEQQPWWQWPEPAARRSKAFLRQLDRDEATAIEAEKQQQWWLQQQWQRLRAVAADCGVQILGDLPFYGAHDSADVWSLPQLFSLRRDGSLEQQRPLRTS